MKPPSEPTLHGPAEGPAAPQAPAETIDAEPPRAEGSEPRALEGRRLGRYALGSPLGEGAMGTVYEAVDTSLGRTVAFKVLQRELSERDRQRIQREALALARLSHPNVVQVYEIGREHGRTFIAMELVRGRTLDGWQRERPPWRECVRVYMQAGQGLAAAHAVGLVHRDFKPSNCILGNDARVRVLDFGLARAADEGDDAQARDGEPPPEEPSLADRLTQTGAVVGTVAYMPLEQLMGASAGVASDQFSFCVSLYEALYGERPFVGPGLGALVLSLRQARIQPAPKRSRVPTRLRKVVLRGLCTAPEERWPSMDALLAELSRVAAPRRRTATVLVGLGGALGLAAGATFFLRGEAEPCLTPETALEGTWGPADRAAVASAFGAEEVASSLPRVTAQLDRYAADWVAMYEDSCRATFVTRQQSGQLFDRRMRCLERRRNRLRSAIDALLAAETSEALVERSIVPFRLPEVAACANVVALDAEWPLPEDPGVGARIGVLREQLDRADTLREAGDVAAGLELAASTVEAARELDYPPLLAEALTSLARLQNVGGLVQDAQATLHEAILMAADTGDARTEAVAWVELLFSDTLAGNTDVGVARELAVWAAVTRADDAVVRTWLLNNLGVLYGERRQLEQSQEYLRQAVAAKQEVLGPEHVDVGISWYNLGNALLDDGHDDEARVALEHALRIFEGTVGPLHPTFHHARSGQCRLALLRGDSRVAVELCGDVLANLVATQASSAFLARVGFMLAQAEWAAGMADEALGSAERARTHATQEPHMAALIDEWLADPIRGSRVAYRSTPP